MKSKITQKSSQKDSDPRSRKIKSPVLWKKSERICSGNNGRPLHPNNKRVKWAKGFSLYPSQRVGTRSIDPYDQRLADKINKLKSKLGWVINNLVWLCEKNNLQISYYTLWSFLHRTGVGFPPREETRKNLIQMKNLLRLQLKAKQKKRKQQSSNKIKKTNINNEIN